MATKSQKDSLEYSLSELEQLKQENARLKKELEELKHPPLKAQYYNSEQWLNLLQEDGDIGLWAGKISGDKEVVWSRGMYQLYGLEPADNITFEDWAARVHPEDFAKAHRPQEIWQGDHDYKVEYRVIWPDNSVHWIFARGQIISDENNNPQVTIGFNLDITERKEAEERARESETLFRSLFESLPDAVFVGDVNGKYIDANPAACQLLGYSREELLSLKSDDFMNLTPEQVIQRRQDFVTHGYWKGEVELKSKSGSLILCEGQTKLVTLPDGKNHLAVGVFHDIRARKASQERIQQAEVLFRTLFENLPDAVLATDGTGRYININSAAIEMLGYSREEFLQMRSVDVLNTSFEMSEEMWHEFTRKGFWQAELELKHKDGRVILTDGRATMVELPNSTGSIGVAMLRDITQKRKAEEDFFRGQQLFQHITDFSDSNIFVKDLQGRFLLVNHRIEKVFGLDRSKILGKTDEEVFPDTSPEYRAVWRANDLEALIFETAIHTEEVIMQPDGLHTVLSTKFPLMDSIGKVYAVCGISTDITDRKRAEELLHRHEQEFRALAENSPDVISRFDRNLVHLYVSPAVEYTSGLKPEQIIGKTNRELGMPEELCNYWEEKTRLVFETGQEQTYEFSWTVPDNTGLHYYQARLTAEFAPNGVVETVLCVVHDITELKRAEERLRFLSEVSLVLASSLDYEDTLQRITNLAVPYMADYCRLDIVEETGQSLRRMGFTHRDPLKEANALAIDYPFPPYLQNLTLEEVLSMRGAVLISQPKEFLMAQNLTPEQQALLSQLDPKSVICVPLILQEKVIGILSFVTAESGRRYGTVDLELAEELARRASGAIQNARLFQESQRAIQTQQELDDLKDLFMALVGHELRTPLTSIKGYAQILQRHLKSPAPEAHEKMFSSAEYIVRQTNRMNTMVTQMLDFSRIQNQQFELQLEPAQNLNELVHRIVEQHRSVGSSHTLLVELPPQPRHAALDTARFEQVLDNLITNAMKYSEPNTTVRVGVRPDPTELVIWVQDEGRGISPEDQALIFNRYYRIKNSKRNKVEGLGLGLYISSQIIRQLGGRMWVESEQGRGSTFFFSLPQS